MRLKISISGVSPEVVNLFAEARQMLKPPPTLTVSSWAEKYRRLSRKDSARPGRWRSEPHQIAIMDAFTDPKVRKVVVKAASQVVGKSQMMNNVIGRFVDVDPSNMMVLHPTISAAEKWSKGRLDPLIEETPALRDKFPSRKSRDSDSTILHRQFRGGQMFIVGVNAPADLAAQSVRILLADEVDRYPPSSGEEGDPLELGEQRTVDYGDFAKVGLFSTPLIEGLSRIDAAYQESDQQEWQLWCPHCKTHFAPMWRHVHWDDDAAGKPLPDTAAIVCPECNTRWSEGDRLRSVDAGQFVQKGKFDGICGFHVNALGCRRVSLPKLVRRWDKAHRNPRRLKAFVNLVLAETYRESGDAPDWQRLLERREDWQPSIVPSGVVFLSAGVDVQPDRVEVRVYGFGRGEQAWLVDVRIVPAKPWDEETSAELTKILNGTWRHESGADLGLARLAIDSGHATNSVYQWAKRHIKRGVLIVKGGPDSIHEVIRAPRAVEVIGQKRSRSGAKVWMVGSGHCKRTIYDRLRLAASEDGSYPNGYIHFPKWIGSDELQQITAEELITETTRQGYARQIWRKIRERNEGLDCLVYAYAAAVQLGMSRWTDAQWTERSLTLGDAASPSATAPAQADRPQTEAGAAQEAPARKVVLPVGPAKRQRQVVMRSL